MEFNHCFLTSILFAILCNAVLSDNSTSGSESPLLSTSSRFQIFGSSHENSSDNSSAPELFSHVNDMEPVSSTEAGWSLVTVEVLADGDPNTEEPLKYTYLSMADICNTEPDCDLDSASNEKTGRNMSLQRCFCDGQCATYGDCCRPNGPPADTTVRCIDIPYFEAKKVGIYAKSYCSDGKVCAASDDDVFSRLPAFSLTSNVVYRNTFCALCNNEHLDKLAFGNVTVKCEKGFNVSLLEGKKLQFFTGTPNEPDPFGVRQACRLSYTLPPDEPAVRCIPSIDSCPKNTSSDLIDLCQSYMETVYLSKTVTVYQNPYCAICRGIDYSSLEYDACTSPLWTSGEVASASNFSISGTSVFEDITSGYSLTILLDLNLANGNVVGSTKKCHGGQVFDPFNSKCRAVYCSGGRHFFEGQCRPGRLDNTPPLLTEANQTVPPGWNLTGDGNETGDLFADRDCPQIEFQASEYTVIGPLLFLNSSGRWYNLSDVAFDGTVAAVCLTDDYEQYVNSFSEPEIVLSIVCYTLSIICLTIHFIMYFLAGKYRLVPDLNMISISLAIFLVQVFVLVAPLAQRFVMLDSVLCAISGVLLHYFMIAAFTWSSIIAYDITKSVLSLQHPTFATVTYSHFVRYSLFAWLTPGIPVVIGLILDATKPHSSFSPVYGKNICYIGRRKSLWVFVGAPVALILLVNLILYVVTATALFKSYRRRRAMKTSSNTASGQSSSAQYRLYVKLAMIMGLAWITAFLAVWVPALRYVSIVTNGLQGVYIFVAFSMKRSIFKAIMQKRQGDSGSFFSHSAGSKKSSLSNLSMQLSNGKLTGKTSATKSTASRETVMTKASSASVKGPKKNEDYYLTTLFPPAAH